MGFFDFLLGRKSREWYLKELKGLLTKRHNLATEYTKLLSSFVYSFRRGELTLNLDFIGGDVITLHLKDFESSSHWQLGGLLLIVWN